MTDNAILNKYSSQEDLSPKLSAITDEICRETGFKLGEELHRRFIYEKDKTWRVKYAGIYQDKPAVLLIVGMKLEEDEETIRQAFRTQAEGSFIRPPHTFLHHPFDPSKGYGFTIEERVLGPMLYRPDEDPNVDAAKFVPFYRALRQAVVKPFWPNERSADAKTFSMEQLNGWVKLAEQKEPGSATRHQIMLDRLRVAIGIGMEGKELRFMHPHLSGSDVRLGPAGEYVVFVNHFWSWRQPSYDMAFPIWHQWMHLPIGKRSAEDVRRITDAWLKAVEKDLSDLVDLDCLRVMLLNRVFGSLILDLPAKAKLAPESAETVSPMFEAFIAEAVRLVAM